MQPWKPAIILVGYNRPDYFKQVLESISNADNDHNEKWDLRIHLEPGYPEMVELAKTYIYADHVCINNTRLGVDWNNFRAFESAANNNYDYILYVEDDTPIAIDALKLAKFHYNMDPAQIFDAPCLQLTSKNRSADPSLVCRIKRFQPWVFGVTKRWFPDFLSHWHVDGRGWDFSLNHGFIQKFKYRPLKPQLARSTNIGKHGGVHCTPDDWAHGFQDHVWAGSNIDPVKFKYQDIIDD